VVRPGGQPRDNNRWGQLNFAHTACKLSHRRGVPEEHPSRVHCALEYLHCLSLALSLTCTVLSLAFVLSLALCSHMA